MAAPRFLDTNVLLRYFTRDDPTKAAAALELLQQVEAGQERLVTSPLVIFETVFTLQHSYAVPKDRVQELVETILRLPGLRLPHKSLFYRAFELYRTTPLSFVDAYNAAYMRSLKITQIYSWDSDFDKIPGISRLEPTVPAEESRQVA